MLSAEVMKYPRVTSIIDAVVTPKPHLCDWIRNKERSGMDTEAYMAEAGERGTAMHDAITLMHFGCDFTVPKNSEDKLARIHEYLKDTEEYRMEMPLWSDKGPHPFRGTPDLIRKVDGVWSVEDWKTGSPSLIKHAIQLHAYRYAAQQQLGISITRLRTLYIGKKGYNFADPDGYPTYLRKDEIQWVDVPVNDGLWESVLHLYAYITG